MRATTLRSALKNTTKLSYTLLKMNQATSQIAHSVLSSFFFILKESIILSLLAPDSILKQYA